jgi:hypothetical protein
MVAATAPSLRPITTGVRPSRSRVDCLSAQDLLGELAQIVDPPHGHDGVPAMTGADEHRLVLMVTDDTEDTPSGLKSVSANPFADPECI